MTEQLSMSAEWEEEILREIFRHTPIGVAVTDLHGQLLEVNDAMCAMLGYEPSHLCRGDLFRFMDKEHVSPAARTMERLRTGEIGSADVVRTLRHRDGSAIRARMTVSVVRSRSGEPVCGLAFVENIEAKLRAEESLRRSEADYRQVVENQTEMIVRGRPDGTRLFVNDAYCRFLGRSREQLMSESWIPSIHAGDLEDVRRGVASLTVDAPVVRQVHRMVNANGEVRWHAWTSRGIFDEGGGLVEIQAVGRDITDERAALEQLERSEKSVRQLFNAFPALAWETDLTGTFAVLQRRGITTPDQLVAALDRDPQSFYELFENARFPRANLAALAVAEGSTPADLQRWLGSQLTTEIIRSYTTGAAPLLLGDEKIVDLELHLRRPDGRRIDLLHRLARLPNWNEERRLIAIALDITDRKKSELDLAHRMRILEEAEELAGIGSWEWDAESGMVYGSAGFWRIMDGTHLARLATNEEVLACFHPDDRPAVHARFESLRTNGSNLEGSGDDTRIVLADGSIVIARGSAFAARAPSGEVTRIYGVIYDVTEQRRAEQAADREREALTRADKMISLGTIVAGVAHEINNPNHYISLNAPLLMRAWRDLEPVVEEYAAAHPDFRAANVPWGEMRAEIPGIIDEIRIGADRIAAIVSELRGFGRDHDPGVQKPVFINDVVTASMRLLANHVRGAKADFALDLASGLPPLMGNAARLQQVVMNLVLNACQALNAPGLALCVATAAQDGRVLLRVTDEGIGIPRQIISKITDPFFTTKRATGGTGLGLAVSNRIVKEHGGELKFESQVGKGTIATVSIPAMVGN